MTMLRYILLILASIPALCWASEKETESTCNSLGLPGSTKTSFHALTEVTKAQVIGTKGELDVNSPQYALCPPEYGVSSSKPPLHCRLITFDWRTLGVNPRDGARILRQWQGAQIELRGTLKPNPHRRDNTIGDLGPIDQVSYIRVLSEAPAPEYCIGSALPSLASPWEARSRTLPRDEEVCVDRTLSSNGNVSYCLEPTRPELWRIEWTDTPTEDGRYSRHSVLPFAPPAPFATRDVFELEPLQDKIFFTLFSGELFLWDGSSSRKLRDALVDEMDNRAGDWLYYRVRVLHPEKTVVWTVVWNAVERTNPLGDIETVWESDTDQIFALEAHSSGDLEFSISTKTGVKRVKCKQARCDQSEFVEIEDIRRPPMR